MTARIPDPVTADLNRRLDQYDRDEKRAAEIENREAEIFNRMQPFSDAEISEALGESPMDLIALAMESGDELLIGTATKGVINRYWRKYARRQAEEEIDEASCKECFDRGCRKCWEPD